MCVRGGCAPRSERQPFLEARVCAEWPRFLGVCVCVLLLGIMGGGACFVWAPGTGEPQLPGSWLCLASISCEFASETLSWVSQHHSLLPLLASRPYAIAAPHWPRVAMKSSSTALLLSSGRPALRDAAAWGGDSSSNSGSRMPLFAASISVKV